MKTLLLIFISLITFHTAVAQGPFLEYKLESKNIIFKGREKTFIILTLINKHDKEMKHTGYGFTAESFSATDSKGNRINDSDWVSGLRRKKRFEPQIVVPAKGTKVLMYTLEQLFKLENDKPITVVCEYLETFDLKIKKPLY